MIWASCTKLLQSDRLASFDVRVFLNSISIDKQYQSLPRFHTMVATLKTEWSCIFIHFVSVVCPIPQAVGSNNSLITNLHFYFDLFIHPCSGTMSTYNTYWLMPQSITINFCIRRERLWIHHLMRSLDF